MGNGSNLGFDAYLYGNGSAGSQSYKNIENALEKIVNEINNREVVSVKIGVNEESFAATKRRVEDLVNSISRISDSKLKNILDASFADQISKIVKNTSNATKAISELQGSLTKAFSGSNIVSIIDQIANSISRLSGEGSKISFDKLTLGTGIGKFITQADLAKSKLSEMFLYYEKINELFSAQGFRDTMSLSGLESNFRSINDALFDNRVSRDDWSRILNPNAASDEINSIAERLTSAIDGFVANISSVSIYDADVQESVNNLLRSNPLGTSAPSSFGQIDALKSELIGMIGVCSNLSVGFDNVDYSLKRVSSAVGVTREEFKSITGTFSNVGLPNTNSIEGMVKDIIGSDSLAHLSRTREELQRFYDVLTKGYYSLPSNKTGPFDQFGVESGIEKITKLTNAVDYFGESSQTAAAKSEKIAESQERINPEKFDGLSASAAHIAEVLPSAVNEMTVLSEKLGTVIETYTNINNSGDMGLTTKLQALKEQIDSLTVSLRSFGEVKREALNFDGVGVNFDKVLEDIENIKSKLKNINTPKEEVPVSETSIGTFLDQSKEVESEIQEIRASGVQLAQLFSDIFSQNNITKLDMSGLINTDQLKEDLRSLEEEFLLMVDASSADDISTVGNEFTVLGNRVHVASSEFRELYDRFRIWQITATAAGRNSSAVSGITSLSSSYENLRMNIDGIRSKYSGLIAQNDDLRESLERVAGKFNLAFDGDRNFIGTKDHLREIRLEYKQLLSEFKSRSGEELIDDKAISSVLSKMSAMSASLEKNKQYLPDAESYNSLNSVLHQTAAYYGLIDDEGRLLKTPEGIVMTKNEARALNDQLASLSGQVRIFANDASLEKTAMVSAEKFRSLREEAAALRDSLQNNAPSGTLNGLNQFITEIESGNFSGSVELARIALNDLKSELADSNVISFNDAINSLNSVETKFNTIRGYLPGVEKEIAKIKEELDAIKKSDTIDTERLNKAKAGVVSIESRVDQMHSKLLKDNVFDSLFRRLLQPYQIIAGIRRIIGHLKEMVQVVSELDSSVTDLQIATGLSKSGARELLQSYADIAGQLGSTTDAVASAADAWLRQGYSGEEANKLIQASTILAKLGQIEEDEATTALTATMNSYGIAVDNVMSIVDKFTKVDMEAAASAGGIAKSLMETATSARLSGVELDKLVGYITTITEVTQDQPESVGTFLKTMFGRMGNIKAGKLSDPETGEDLSNVEAALRGQGLSLRESSGEFRNFGEILDEVASRWDTMSEAQKRAIGVAVGASRNQEKFFVLMEHYNEALDYTSVSANSAGTAIEKYSSSYLTSIEAAKNSLTTANQALAMNMFNSDSMIGLYDASAKLVNMLANIADHTGGIFGLVSMLLPVVGGIIGKSNTLLGVLKNTSVSSINLFGNIKTLAATFLQARSAGIGFTAQLKHLTKDANTTAQASGALSGAFSLIGVAIAAVTIAYTAYRSHQEKVKVAMEEAADAYKSTEEEIDSYKQKFIQLRKEISETDDTTEIAAKKDELLQIETELIEKYGAEAKSLQLVTGEIEAQKDAIDKLSASKYLELSASSGELLSKEAKKNNNYKYSLNQMSYNALPKYLKNSGSLLDFDNVYTGSIPKTNITGNISDVRKFAEEAYSYVEKHQKEFSDSEINDIKTFFKVATDEYNEYYAQINQLGKGYFSHSASTQEQNKYTELLTLIEKYENDSLKNSSDIVSDLKKIQDIESWFDSNIDNEAAKAYIHDMLSGVYPADIELMINITDVMSDDKAVKDAIKSFLNDSGEIDYNTLVDANDYFGGGKIDSKNAGQKLWADDHGLDGKKEDFNTLIDLSDKCGISLEKLIDLFVALGLVKLPTTQVENLEEAVESLSSKLKGFSDAQGSLQKIVNILSNAEEGKFNVDDVSEAIEVISGAGMATDEWVEKIRNAYGDSDKLNSVIQGMTDEFVNYIVEKNNMTAADEAWLESILDQNGVTNAAEVAHAKLSDSIRLNANQLGVLEKATGKSIEYTKIANGVYEISAKTLSGLGMTAQDAAAAMIRAQFNITEATREGVKSRIAMYLAEAEAFASMGASNVHVSRNANGEIDPRARSVMASYGLNENGTPKYNVEELQSAYDLIKGTPVSASYDFSGVGGSSGSSGGGKSQFEIDLDKKKHLLEMDKITTEEYYNWLRNNQNRADSDSLPGLQEELYQWEKDKIDKSISEQQAVLDNKHEKGLISEAEYQKQLGKIYEDGYGELLKKVQSEDLYGVDAEERLEKENELIQNIKSAHTAQYEAEKADLEHARSMNLITEEAYYLSLGALSQKYYAGQKMYVEEMKDAEEELYNLRCELIEKWADAAEKAIEGVANTSESIVERVRDLVDTLIETNRTNFDLENSYYKHFLEMNYITSDEYYTALDDLYKRYFANKYTYLEDYWEYEEELYKHEMDIVNDTAGGIEDIHSKVVEMIKKELDDAKSSIDSYKKSYSEIIDIRKKALQDMKDEDDYEKEKTEKLSTISELKRQLNALAYDSSSAGVARYKEVYAQLVQAQKELDEFEKNRAYDVSSKRLDEMKSASDTEYDAELKEIEAKLDDPEWLRQEAWNRINSMGEELYNQLIEYNNKYSTSIKDDITDSWNSAKRAFDEYGQDVDVFYKNLQDRINNPQKYSPITESEFELDAVTVQQKKSDNYILAMAEFVKDMADISADGIIDIASIIEEVFPSEATKLMADGANALAAVVGSTSGIGMSVLSIAMALGGTTGVLQTLHVLSTLSSSSTDGISTVINGGSVGSIISNIGAFGTLIPALISALDGGRVGTSLAGVLSAAQQMITGVSEGSGSITDALTNGGNVASGILSLIGGLIGEDDISISNIGTLLSSLLGVVNEVKDDTSTTSSSFTALLSSVLSVAKNLFGNSNSGNSVIKDASDLIVKICEQAYNALGEAKDNIGTGDKKESFIGNFVSNLFNTIKNLFAGNFASGTSNVGRDGIYRTDELGEELKFFKGKTGNYTMLTSGSKVLNAEMTERLMRIAKNPRLLSGNIRSAIDVGSLASKVKSGGNKSVAIHNEFIIKSNDPKGVAKEVKKLMPEIADYTINSMVSGMSNKGIKRKASSLV